MKVVQLIKTAEGATWAWRQVRELVKNGFEVHVVLPSAGPMAPRYVEVGATVHFQPCDIALVRSPVAFIKSVRALRRLIQSIDPDIVHSHFVGTTLTMRLALAGTKFPRVFQVPGLLHLENRFTRVAERLSASRRDYWTASCELTRTIYQRQGIDRARIGLAYYGTDFALEPLSESGQLRFELGIPRTEPIVGMVAYAYAPKRWLGYKRGIKGHEDLIDALALLHAKGVPVHGVFVGGAWAGADAYYKGIVEYGRERLGRFAHFLGTRHDIQKLYPDFDVVVHPSHSENLGGAVESLALAVPTIATDTGGFPDIVRPNETGWLTPAKDPAQLSNVIEQSLTEPERGKTMAGRGRTLVLELLDSRQTAAQMAAVYRAIADERPLS